jgi:hypothetical protein
MTLKAWRPDELDRQIAYIKSIADTDFRLGIALTLLPLPLRKSKRDPPRRL